MNKCPECGSFNITMINNNTEGLCNGCLHKFNMKKRKKKKRLRDDFD